MHVLNRFAEFGVYFIVKDPCNFVRVFSIYAVLTIHAIFYSQPFLCNFFVDLVITVDCDFKEVLDFHFLDILYD